MPSPYPPGVSIATLRKRVFSLVVALVAAPAVIWLVFERTGILSPFAAFLTTFGVVVLLAVVAASLAQSGRRQFKRDVVAPAMARLQPGALYRPGQGIAESVTRSTCLLPRGPRFKCDDLVRARVDGVAFQSSNVIVERDRTSRSSGTETETLFSGLFLQLILPTSYDGVTLLLPDGDEPPRKPEKGTFEKVRGTRGGWDVWTTSPASASAVLASTIPEALASVAAGRNVTLSASVSGDRLSIASPVGDLLEAGFEPAADGQIADEIAEEIDEEIGATFAFVGALAQKLRLAIPPQMAAADLNLLFGDRVAPDAIPELAQDARGLGVDVELRGPDVEFRYGWSMGLVTSLAINALWLTLAGSVNGRVVGWPGHGAIVDNLALSSSLLQRCVDWLASHHPWSVAVLAAMPALSFWLLRGQHPHRVTLSRETIRRRSRTWPGEQTKRIPDGSEVRFDQGAVVVGVPGSFGTRVSPPLSIEAGTVVARLVASHLGVEVRLGSGPRGRTDGMQ